MSGISYKSGAGHGSVQKSASTGAAVGKRTLVEQISHAPVQRHAAAGAPAVDTAQVHEAAAQGVATSSSPLPHGDAIQRSFGRHDISSVQAHTGGAAVASAQAMGADAYASGNHVVLGTTDLHTVAHEAAHVVQQRGGVQLKGGVGEEGDPYERHADEVADAVVQGKSAESLLDRHAGGAQGGASAGTPAVQGHFQISRADFAARNVTGAGDPRFSAQEPPTPNGSYLKPDGTTNIVARTIATVGALRISNDGLLAIEDREGGERQAKTFFIEPGLIAGANAELVKAKSQFRLLQQGGSITVPDMKAQLHTLVQVVAQNVKNESAGDDVVGAVNCDEMAGQVGGWGADHNKIARVNKSAPDWPNEEGHRVAAYIVEYGKSPSLKERVFSSKSKRASEASNYALPGGSSPAEILMALNPKRDEIAAAYGTMSADDKRKAIEALGLNEAAAPKVGEALVTFSTGAKKDGVVRDHESGRDVAARWGQHWGGVVARSGGDYVTLENYDRKGEDEGRGGLPGPTAETRAFFQMYGSAAGQTWHEIQKGTGEFPNAVSLVYGNKNAEK